MGFGLRLIEMRPILLKAAKYLPGKKTSLSVTTGVFIDDMKRSLTLGDHTNTVGFRWQC